MKFTLNIIVLCQVPQLSGKFTRFPLHNPNIHLLVHSLLVVFLNSELILSLYSSAWNFLLFMIFELIHLLFSDPHLYFSSSQFLPHNITKYKCLFLIPWLIQLGRLSSHFFTYINQWTENNFWNKHLSSLICFIIEYSEMY